MPTPTLIALIIAVVVLALLAGLFVLLRNRMREMGIYVVPRTKFGTALIFTVEDDSGDPVRVLNVGGMYQSATYLDDRYADLVFEYYRLYDHMFEAGIDLRSVLMIGGGGYAYPKHLVAHHPELSVGVVEIDPKITSLAQRYFFLDRLIEEYETEQTGRLELIEGDGRAVLDRLAADPKGARYDAVLNDSFRGKEPASSMTTVETARSVKACLNPGGLYLSNVVASLEGNDARFLRAIVATLRQVFANVYVIPCGDESLAEKDNAMVIATDGVYAFTDAVPFETTAADPVLTDAHNPVKELTR